jgi:hypothetical protein
MGALLARLLDDAALCPPGRAPMRATLAAHRAAVRHPAVGRLLCPASRFAELRAHLVPEDLLDLGVIADTGVEGLPETLDAVRAEPRVRATAVRIALPGDADDQARAATVTIAGLPPDTPAHIEVRRSPGWRDALDRLSAARDHGAPLGAAHPAGGDPAAFITACAERDLAFTCAASPEDVVDILLATARAATGRHDLRHAADLLTLTETDAVATRRLLLAVSTPDTDTALSTLPPG